MSAHPRDGGVAVSDCYRETQRTARKRHTCCECMATIDPGEHYVQCSGVSEGEGWSYKLCAFCCALAEQARGESEEPEWGPTFCGLQDWLFQACEIAEEGLVVQLFPLIDERIRKRTIDYCARSALGLKRGSRARGVRIGQRLAAQLRLRALRASRWTVDGRAA